jgi:hypothetical protein
VTGEGGAALERPRRATRTVPDRILGGLGAGMMVLALVVLIRGGTEDGGTRPLVTPPPAVELLEPAAGAVIAGSMALLFEVEDELAPQPSGWGVGGFHLHLRLDGLELMPGAADVAPLSSGAYRWNVGPLEPGPHRLQLFWSDQSHAPVEGGESAVVEVTAAP